MKKHLLFLFSYLTIFSISNNALAQCNGRYQTEIFTQVTKTADITFGANTTAQGSNQNLTMDIYEPAGDNEPNRPLFVLAHGGSFIAGTKNDADVVAICNSFAKRGYVTASYNYRLGFATGIPNKAEATRAVYRAVQDAKACIRWFWKSAREGNPYKIDTNQIFLGGSSAGAFIAIHYAYLNEESELPSDIDINVLGDLHGNSGNPGYPEKIKAIVNLCGAIGDLDWIKPADIPICSMHGTNDATVPYGTQMLYMLQFIPIMVVSGSYSIDSLCQTNGTVSWFYTFKNAPHVPYLNNANYMDTTVRFISDFLYMQLDCSTGLEAAVHKQSEIFPNPSTGIYHIITNDHFNQVKVYNNLGQELLSVSGNYQNDVSVNLMDFPDGVYHVEISSKSQAHRIKVIKVSH